MVTLDTYTRLEVRTVFTPLGIRFWDPVFDRPVTDNLQVTAQPAVTRRPVVQAFRTRSGVYAFQNLPGLKAVEYPPTPDQIIASPPPAEAYVITVTDHRRRFLPVAFEETLPLPYQGIFPGAAPGSLPDDSPPGFYLFSAPTRPVASGIAVVRAHLVDRVTGAPAAHALLTVQHGDNEPWYGLADAAGQAAVQFPYPIFTVVLSTSPPGGPPPDQQAWPLTVRIYYAPDSLGRFEAVPPPDFRTIAMQSPGLIHPTDNPAGSPLESLPVELAFGQELVLRTTGLATLLISSVDSLP